MRVLCIIPTRGGSKRISRKNIRAFLGELIAQLHLVAALATLGRQPAAADVLRRVNPARYGADAALIRGSLASPTYLPGNRPIRWQPV